MGTTTAIAWTDHTFNPWWGCTKVSEGCDNCYADAFDHRLGGTHWGKDAPRRFFGDNHWRDPAKWNRRAEKDGVRRRVFCASMADVFEPRGDLDVQRERLWRLVADTPSLDWLLLTKRPEQAQRLAPWGDDWPANVWLGTTTEDQANANRRIPRLLAVPAQVRFLSYEPAVGPLTFRWAKWVPLINGNHLDGLRGIHWVIVGGESGPRARAMPAEWALRVVGECRAAGVAVFVKQLGTALGGTQHHDIDTFPESLRYREWPSS